MHAPLWLPAGCILACLPVVFLLIPESTTRDRGHIDWLGAVLLSLGLGAAMLALAQGGTWGWASAQMISLFIGAIVLLAGFAATELRVPEPLVDLRAIAGRSMAPLYVLSFVLGATLFGAETAGATFSATPKMFGFGFGLDTLGLALTALPTSMAMLIAATFADRVARAVSPRATLIAAFGLVALGYLGMAGFHAQLWQTISSGVLVGLGTGFALGALPTVIMVGLPADQTGIGIGLYNTLKALAGSVVSAVFAVVMNRNLLKLPIPGVKLSDQHAYVLVWSACAAIALLGVLVATAVRASAATRTEDTILAAATTAA